MSATFERLALSSRKLLEQETRRARRLLADELGHGRSYLLDSEAELEKRSQWVRDLGKKA